MFLCCRSISPTVSPEIRKAGHSHVPVRQQNRITLDWNKKVCLRRDQCSCMCYFCRVCIYIYLAEECYCLSGYSSKPLLIWVLFNPVNLILGSYKTQQSCSAYILCIFLSARLLHHTNILILSLFSPNMLSFQLHSAVWTHLNVSKNMVYNLVFLSWLWDFMSVNRNILLI